MILIGFILGLIGLILDIIGVTKIFLLKVGPFRELPNLNIGGMMNMGSYSSDNKISFLKNSIDSAFKKFNRDNSNNDSKAKKYFIMIFIGFFLQIVGLIISNIPIMLDYLKYAPCY